MRARLTKWAVLVRMVCALALLSVGFAHKPVLAEPVSPAPQFSAYALPNGSLPVFCVTDTGAGTDTEKGKHASRDCDACRLSASVLLPAAPRQITPQLAAVSTSLPTATAEAEPKRLLEPNRAPRAPPQGFLTA